MPTELSQREKDVLRLLGKGKTTGEIARQLGIAESTVVWYISRAVTTYGPRRTEQIAFRLARATRRRLLAVAILLLVLACAAVIVSTAGRVEDLLTGDPIAPPTAAPAATTVNGRRAARRVRLP